MRWPFTKCFSGTLSGALRPGSASSGAGIAAFLRNSVMSAPPRAMAFSVGAPIRQLKARAPLWRSASRTATVRDPACDALANPKLPAPWVSASPRPAHAADRESCVPTDPVSLPAGRSVPEAAGPGVASAALVLDPPQRARCGAGGDGRRHQYSRGGRQAVAPCSRRSRSWPRAAVSESPPARSAALERPAQEQVEGLLALDHRTRTPDRPGPGSIHSRGTRWHPAAGIAERGIAAALPDVPASRTTRRGRSAHPGTPGRHDRSVCRTAPGRWRNAGRPCEFGLQPRQIQETAERKQQPQIRRRGDLTVPGR